MTRATPWLAALFALMPTTSPVSAEIYRWVDKEGTVEFDQFAPPGEVRSTTVNPRYSPAPAPADDGATPPAAENEPAVADRPPAGQPAPNAERERAELYRRNCTAAKKNLETYQFARRVRLPDGTIEVMTDELRQEKEAAAREQIEKYCR